MLNIQESIKTKLVSVNQLIDDTGNRFKLYIEIREKP